MTISRRHFAVSTIGALTTTTALGGASFARKAFAAQESVVAPGTLKWKFQTGDWLRKHDPEFTGNAVIVNQKRFIIALDPATGNYRWQFETSSEYVSHTVVDGVVYIGDWDSNVIALDAETGEERWRFATNEAIHSAPTLVDGSVYVAGRELYALNAATGAEHWRFSAPNGLSSPEVAGGLVYVGAGDNNVYALDVETGAERWRFDTGRQVFESPTYADGTVYVGGGHVFALDAMSGNERWRFETSGAGSSRPAVVGNTVFVGTGGDDSVYALDSATGSILWRFQTGSYISASPVLVDGTLYTHSHDGTLYALNPETGTELWRFATEYVDPPALWVDDEIVYLHRNSVIALDSTTGIQLWRTEYPSNDGSSVTFVDGALYFSSADNSVYALEGNTATERWRFLTGIEVTSVKEVDGTVYAAGNGAVHAIDAETGAQRWQIDVQVADEYAPPPVPVILDGILFISGDDNVIAVDAATGSERWRLSVLGWVHSAEDGTVFINDYGYAFAYSVDAATGSELWRSDEGEYFSTVANGTAYIETSNAEVYAVDTATGSEKWRYSTDGDSIWGTMVDGSVYILGSEGIDALDAENGHQLWSVAIESGYSTPVVANNTMLLSINEEYGESLSALDAASGSERWSFFVDTESIEELTVANGVVYFGAYHGDTTTTLYGLDLDSGAERWSVYSESGDPEWFTIVDGTIYVTFDSYDYLYALNAETGGERWQHDPEDSITSPADVSKGTLYFGSEDLNVYAIVAEPTRFPSLASDSAAVTLIETPVRAAPLPTGNVVTTLPVDTEVFISGSSKESGGITWWPVITPDGTEGWIDGSMLRGKP